MVAHIGMGTFWRTYGDYGFEVDGCWDLEHQWVFEQTLRSDSHRSQSLEEAKI